MLFKKTTKKKSVNTVNDVIEEIHETFYTEVDKLLASAKIINSLDTDKQSLIEKCERLKLLGFTNTKEVKEAEKEITRLNELKQNNKEKETLIEAINYFSNKYPCYKFITEDSVQKICAKYSLIYGTINKYIGTVSDKNLAHIENFKVSDEDECYIWERRSEYSLTTTYMTLNTFNKRIEAKRTTGLVDWSISRDYYLETEGMCPLEIVATPKDFVTRNNEIKNYNLIKKFQITDPIVLKPVIFKEQKYYLIVTAWGQEANDEMVVNQKMN